MPLSRVLQWSAVRFRVHDTFLNDVPLLALCASGVPSGTMYRALGCAMDICDALASRPLPARVAPLCVAIVRYALKCELSRDHLDAIREHLSEGGLLHRPGVHAAECRIVMLAPSPVS